MAQTSMQAVLIKDGKGPIENLYIGDTTRPEPSGSQVLVKIKAFGLNRMDLMQRQGFYPVPKGASTILGVEFSGTVEAVGAEVIERKVGEKVFGLASGGAYAEYIVVHETHLICKPDHLSWTAAAGIPECWLTAFQGLIEIGKLKEGEDVLIHAGASGVGLAAIQLAKLFKAKTIIATASTQEKLDFMLKLGATHAVNYRTQDFAAEVKDATGGKGVDVLIDFVGQSHWHKNMDSLAIDGRMTMLAFLSGSSVDNVDLRPILLKRLHIEGSTLRARSVSYQSDLINGFKSRIWDALQDGRLQPVVHRVYPWTEIQEAQREMQADKNIGKIIVIVGEDVESVGVD